MTDATRIALIHATRLAIDPIVNAFDTQWQDAEHISILDESLVLDRRKDEHLTEALSNRIVALCRHAEGVGSDGVLFTCSAFGEAIEKAALSSSVPVLKPNEAMFEKALSMGDRITMVYTFPPALAGMEQEFLEEAARCQSSARIQSVYAEGARQAVEQGDIEKHNEIISNTISSVKDADAILLAHFSMATAERDARSVTDIPVISSPTTAIEKMKSLATPGSKTIPC